MTSWCRKGDSMTDETKETNPKSNKGKWSIIIIVAIAIIGGAATIFFLLPGSDKETFFLAEKESYEVLSDEVEERFANELEWAEMSEENPTESKMELSAEYNDPNSFGGVSEVEEIINNSTINITSQADLEAEEIFADIEADVAGLTFDDIRFGITDNTMLLQLPFLKDVLQLNGDDTGKLLHEIDPMTFDEDDNYDFSQIFKGTDYPISEEDRDYITDKYGKFLFKELPDSAFESEKEEVEVDGESFKAEKVNMHLDEEEVQTLVADLLDEIDEDERLKEIIEAYLEQNFIPADELAEFQDDFDEGIQEMKDSVDEIVLPEGIDATVWVKDGLVVKRNFAFTTEDNFGDEVSFEIDGTQLLDDNKKKFDYDINVDDGMTDETISLVGDLGRDGDDIKDTITLSVDQFDITYEGDETLKDSDHEFTRSLSLDSPYISGGLFWTGDAKYEKDQTSANHEFHVEAEGLGEDVASLQVGVEGKKIKEIESIDTDNVKDIGKMSEAELNEYIEGEAAEQFFEWYVDKFGDLGGFGDPTSPDDSEDVEDFDDMEDIEGFEGWDDDEELMEELEELEKYNEKKRQED